MARQKVQAGGILRTPRLLRERVQLFFKRRGDWLDPAAPPDNPLEAPRFFCGPSPSRIPSQGPLFGEPTMEEANRLDGLHEDWDLPWFCNPPFKRIWYERATSQILARPDQPAILLLPVNRTEEHYVHPLLRLIKRRLFVDWPTTRGRIPFESSIDGAEVDRNPFASWILGFGNVTRARWLKSFGDLGTSHELKLISTSPQKRQGDA